ncbi:MAG: hypothetical protein RMX65_010675 [Nostoc sp. DedQUE01]|nr:hypothetical protein [Nostoc sp. DedQUE01]MDZ8079705.1 hypothetical protein [Nostoc sp. DcaGUA01]
MPVRTTRAAASCQQEYSILNRLKNNLINVSLLTNILAIALRVGKQVKREMVIFSLIFNLGGEQV